MNTRTTIILTVLAIGAIMTSCSTSGGKTGDNNGYVVTRLSGPLTFGSNDEDGVFYEYTYMRDMQLGEDGSEYQ